MDMASRESSHTASVALEGAFSPGPWTLKPRPARYPLIGNGTQIWSGNVRVASVSHAADKPINQKVADAHLIAAAPSMFRALQEIASTDEGASGERARAALLLATG
jgi:hypothetical protein